MVVVAKFKLPVEEFFSELPDPRVERTRKHALLDVVVIAILAVICRAEGWDDIAWWGEDNEDWLGTILELPHGVPSADTFRRVISALDPTAFEACFRKWALALCETTAGKLVAIDGKTVRGSVDAKGGTSALHLVNAWVADNDLVFGQLATAEKSSEYTAIPELIELLELRGATVSIDAAGCHVAIAQKLIDKKADYLLALKGNQKTLHEEVVGYFDDAMKSAFQGVEHTFDEASDKGHGRLETRRTWACSDVGWITRSERWPKLASIVLVESTRTVGEKTSVERRTYITRSKAPAAELGRRVREHWSIENKLHGVLDVGFSEDRARLRRDHGPRNFSLLRKLTMNMMKKAPGKKNDSMVRRRKKADRSHDYLLQVLAAGMTSPLPALPATAPAHSDRLAARRQALPRSPCTLRARARARRRPRGTPTAPSAPSTAARSPERAVANPGRKKMRRPWSRGLLAGASLDFVV
jgi:predicted transposase YbfD/YdcC